MHTRPYQVERDDALVFEAFRSARWDEVRAWGFDEQQATCFLRMQHQAQRSSYAVYYPAADWTIVEAEQAPVGYVCVDRGPQAITLVDIALLPSHQNRGLGSRVLEALQREAQRAGIPLQLSVRPESRARALYARLGFCVVATDPLHLRMSWSPSSARAEDEDSVEYTGGNRHV